MTSIKKLTPKTLAFCVLSSTLLLSACSGDDSNTDNLQLDDMPANTSPIVDETEEILTEEPASPPEIEQLPEPTEPEQDVEPVRPSEPQEPEQPTQTEVTLLAKGAAQMFSANKGEQLFFRIRVTENANNLNIRLRGGQGDADLYVRKGLLPNLESYDCRPFANGNDETCVIQSLETGDYYILINAKENYRNVSLTADYIDDTPNVSDADCEVSDEERALLAAHNAYRAEGRSCGGAFFRAAAPLTWSCQLASAAKGHSQDMASNNYFNHDALDGSSAGDRISREGYVFSAWGENIAAGQRDVAQVMDGWIKSAGHCRNIMSENVTELGAARADEENSTYRRYWTTVFARPR